MGLQLLSDESLKCSRMCYGPRVLYPVAAPLLADRRTIFEQFTAIKLNIPVTMTFGMLNLAP